MSLFLSAMQHHHRNHSHLSSGGLTTPGGAISVAPDPKRGKKRGSYNCGRCGQPKKGHSCHVTPTDSTPSPADSSVQISATSSSLPTTRPPTLRQAFSHLRRALSFEDDVEDVRDDLPETEAEDEEEELDFGDPSLDLESGGLPANCLWDILRRLPPPGLLAAARVCKGWRESARRVWRAAEELKLRVPARAQVGFVESVLKKCPGLVRLSLRIERLGYFHKQMVQSNRTIRNEMWFNL